MAWHKQKHYDPTEAFIQNERQQKLLNLQLEKIDKLWLHQLRLYARNRLETTSELIRLDEEKSQLAYFNDDMDSHQMKQYTDTCLTHMKTMKREITQDNYNFENTGAMIEKRAVQQQLNLPTVGQIGCIVTQSLKKKTPRKKTNRPRLSKRRKSNLFRSKILSVSDSNLDMISKYKRENCENNLTDTDDSKSNNTRHSAKSKGSSESLTTQLPAIASKPAVRGKEQHRYLKEKMATALVLPTVTEAKTRQRKLSI